MVSGVCNREGEAISRGKNPFYKKLRLIMILIYKLQSIGNGLQGIEYCIYDKV